MSWSGCAYLLSLVLLLAGLKRRKLALGGFGLAVLTVGVRLGTAASGDMLRLDTTDGQGARLLARLVDEGDLALPGAYLVGHWLHDPEASSVPAALRAAYREMRAKEGDAPSPVVTTYLGLESPERADVVVIEPPSGTPRGALIFLHGFAGNFSLPCWLMAQAAPDLVTYCPSVGWRGDWWSAKGARTLERTLALVHRRGLEQVYLAGLSNGAAGAAHLAPRMRGSFRGLILISGAARESQAPGIPVLVIQGRRDQMSSAELARSYAGRTHSEYLDLEGGHFAFLLRRDRSLPAISDWLRRH